MKTVNAFDNKLWSGTPSCRSTWASLRPTCLACHLTSDPPCPTSKPCRCGAVEPSGAHAVCGRLSPTHDACCFLPLPPPSSLPPPSAPFLVNPYRAGIFALELLCCYLFALTSPPLLSRHCLTGGGEPSPLAAVFTSHSLGWGSQPSRR